MGVDGVVDLSRYPLHNQDSGLFATVLEQSRNQYRRNGLVTLPGFLLPTAIQTAVEDITSNLEQMWETDDRHNVFQDRGDPAFPDYHVRNKLLPTKVGFLAYDMMSTENPSFLSTKTTGLLSLWARCS